MPPTMLPISLARVTPSRLSGGGASAVGWLVGGLGEFVVLAGLTLVMELGVDGGMSGGFVSVGSVFL